MNKLLFAPLLLTVLLAACSRDEAPATDTAAAPATTEAASPAAIPDEPALDPSAPAAAATDDVAATAPAATDPAADAAVAAASQAALQGPGPVAGTDYVEITGGQPFAPLAGKIEVVEVFAYSCGHCAAFDPLITAWKNKLPGDVRFNYLPAVFSDQDNFPKAFFAAEAIGALDKVHANTFKAMHIERSLRPNASSDDIIKFMAKQGVDGAQLKGTMDSFAVNAKVGRAKQFAVRSGIDSTPTVVVNGKYRVRGRSLEDVLRITDQLIARERATMQAGGGN
ncbi:thiol:disulfide interchange protein DsbA/DsbL [Luteimonas sp. MC1825]|uniref:thiol:disulfide interchange protein DsbA/DsbL n=1 Tax=Luteimonas sp. MC1825 TaxID=2761107 RepID=UPI001613CC59|nr:thiol:disulfide interchange protein DsbA/DsbL [Luteimonas sp. MC1825]MBB6598239.1 thiol:disulfide interchange protein DsbA/DsbL [Luteimonas sp. MC1825]QOC88456.1 thiol:disulfide interchange protein DsbA/DsbL [Luteimonas sp. MC1825]